MIPTMLSWVQVLLLIAFVLAVAWNWKGYQDRSYSRWGTPGYVFAIYATFLCTLLIFVLLLVAAKSLVFLAR